MGNPEKLDFKKVEALRTHMLLTIGNMAKAIGVSRVTYTGWVNGKPIRPVNDAKARAALRMMFKVIETHHWPSPAAIAMSQPQRITSLLELMNEAE